MGPEQLSSPGLRATSSLHQVKKVFQCLRKYFNVSVFKNISMSKIFHFILLRCMVQVHSKVWLGYRNRIHIVDPKMMCVEATLDAHPRYREYFISSRKIFYELQGKYFTLKTISGRRVKFVRWPG